MIRVSHATRPLGVVLQNRVQDGVRHLVGDLVRVALGDRLGREEELARRRHEGANATYSIPTKANDLTMLPSFSPYATSERSGSRFRETSGGTDSPETEAKPMIRSIVSLRSIQARLVYWSGAPAASSASL